MLITTVISYGNGCLVFVSPWRSWLRGAAVATPCMQVSSLTGMDISNASLLDEGTAAAEAVNLVLNHSKSNTVYVADDCHPQTIGVVKVRRMFGGVPPSRERRWSVAVPRGPTRVVHSTRVPCLCFRSRCFARGGFGGV